MPYTPQLVTNFGGGLNLRDKADTVQPGQAIDALNVYFTERGSVTQRPGTGALNASALGTAPKGLLSYVRTSTSDRQLLVGGNGKAYVLNTAGATVGSELTGTAAYPYTFERFGSPGNEYAYAANGYDTVASWNGSAWTSPANMPKAGVLAVVNTPSSASGLAPRMAAAGFTTSTGGPGGTTTNPSYVHFSDAGTAEAWTTSNYIQLAPGDGEKIAALVAWRGFIFAFKQSKFFVFYGESLDSSNNPIFNYRAVDVGEGVSGPYAVVAARDAVYFANENGVFRTTGQDVQKISDPVDPIFSGDTADYWKGGTLARNKTADMALGYHGDLLYVSYSSGGSYNDRTLVYDTEQKWWSLYDFPASSFGTFKVSNDTELVFTRATTSNQVIRHNATYTNDLGSAITARWRSGWTDFGVNSTKVIRESKVWGAGKCYLAQTSDYDTSVGVSQVVDFQQAALTEWGSSTWGGGAWEYPVALVQRMVRLASRGTVFSTVFSNSELNKTFQISRIQHHLRATRIPSVRDTENLT
jgi:hypothetical protein